MIQMFLTFWSSGLFFSITLLSEHLASFWKLEAVSFNFLPLSRLIVIEALFGMLGGVTADSFLSVSFFILFLSEEQASVMLLQLVEIWLKFLLSTNFSPQILRFPLSGEEPSALLLQFCAASCWNRFLFSGSLTGFKPSWSFSDTGDRFWCCILVKRCCTTWLDPINTATVFLKLVSVFTMFLPQKIFKMRYLDS